MLPKFPFENPLRCRQTLGRRADLVSLEGGKNRGLEPGRVGPIQSTQSSDEGTGVNWGTGRSIALAGPAVRLVRAHGLRGCSTGFIASGPVPPVQRPET